MNIYMVIKLLNLYGRTPVKDKLVVFFTRKDPTRLSEETKKVEVIQTMKIVPVRSKCL